LVSVAKVCCALGEDPSFHRVDLLLAISSCMWLGSSTLICAILLRAGRKKVGRAAKSQLDDCNQQMQERGADHKHRAAFFENYDLL
jgi:hypothetical protein